jgi:hypothetical protein
MILDDFIDQEQRIPLDKDDVLKLIYRPGVRYFYYNDIGPRTTLKHLLPKPNSGCVILFVSEKKEIGHFCLLFRHKRSGLHFFDPYGFGLKRVIDLTGSDHRLQQLIKGTDIKINKHAFQKMKKGRVAVNTCGRHVACRYNAAHMTSEEYERFLYHRSMDPDEIVTMLTCEQDISKLDK